MDAHLLILCLLLAAGVCPHLAAHLASHLARAGPDSLASLPEDQGTLLRRLWQLSMRDFQLKGKAEPPPHPIRGPVTQQLLYCRVGIGYHLQILSNGTVGGVHEPSEHSLLKVFAMKRGVVGIKGVKSGLYLSMSQEGILHGAEPFSDDCLFRENLEENYYNTYSSLSYPGVYLALSHKGEVKKGTSVNRHQHCTHFLPRRAPENLTGSLNAIASNGTWISALGEIQQ